jgi:predicted Rossmann-fold nucleotide-binding protein
MYDVIQAGTLEELVQAVREKMNDRYEPIGGVIFVQYYGQYIFLQSVRKAAVYSIDNWYGRDEKPQKT